MRGAVALTVVHHQLPVDHHGAVAVREDLELVIARILHRQRAAPVADQRAAAAQGAGGVAEAQEAVHAPARHRRGVGRRGVFRQIAEGVAAHGPDLAVEGAPRPRPEELALDGGRLRAARLPGHRDAAGRRGQGAG